nr:class I SAM-dependent methyltransferase [Actinopolymorpha cephalotaxi]
MVPPGASVVADVGAGTGKLTGALLERGLRVEAVEPDVRMLDVLRRVHPRARTHNAGAEEIPLGDTSVDAVLAADAWHWFPFEQAVAQTRRVLRPGGWLGLVWSMAAPIEPWEKELAAVDPSYAPPPEEGADDEGPFPAEETETATFRWVWRTTPGDWCSYLETLSVFVLMPARERGERLRRAHALVSGACRAAGSATAPVHHQAVCVRWRPGCP